jgi:PEP-CTERM motif
MHVVRTVLLGTVMAVCQATAAAITLTLNTPTPAPYLLTGPVVHPNGPFMDVFQFEVNSADAPSFLWLLPQAHLASTQARHGITGLQLALYALPHGAAPSLVGAGQQPAILGNDLSDPVSATQVALWSSLGYDLRESLYWEGRLAPGTYAATVSGWAGGTDADLTGGGAYLLKLRVSSVPEPASVPLALAGAGLALAVRRMKSVSRTGPACARWRPKMAPASWAGSTTARSGPRQW